MIRRLLLLALLALALPARADEGMWTFNAFPSAMVQQQYGFGPSQEWLDHVRLSAVRIAGGCSASVVSASGLVMTNHHCVHRCVEKLSTPKVDYVKSGFLARQQKDELRCPAMELNQLAEITDVTARVQQATRGAAPERFYELQKAEIARIEQECATSDTVRCDVVNLYRGGRYDLYRYQRFQDVRLVFAPELAIASFGGDPDNFNFPRFDLDAAFLRIYGADGKPQPMAAHLAWSKDGAKDGELTFVAGNPGGTSRLLTVAQLEALRDHRIPWQLARLSELRGMLKEFAKRSPEAKRTSTASLFYAENGLKALKGRHATLAKRAFMASKVAAEQAFRKKVEADPKLKAASGAAWDQLAASADRSVELMRPYTMLEAGGITSELFAYARTLLRAAVELPLANADRLPEYSDAKLPALRQKVASTAPVYPELEVLTLAWSLSKLREELGPDHPAVKDILGVQSPEELAKAAVAGSRLGDPKARQRLLDGGKAAVDASKDPMLALVRAFEPHARAIRKTWESEVDGPTKKASELLARAFFQVHGTNIAPDATFTLRLNVGRVQGWTEAGAPVPPFTTLAGAFARATGKEPYALPRSWLEAKGKLALDTPFDFVTTNDIIGGNSGSPVINQAGEVVGLVFDGNLHSLGGDYGFDGSVNRAVAVHSAAILEALGKVYGATRLVEELRPPPSPAESGPR